MGCSPHHRCSSQKAPGKSRAMERVERKRRKRREEREEMKLEELRREIGWVDCMEEVQLGRCGEALSNRGGRGVMKQAER